MSKLVIWLALFLCWLNANPVSSIICYECFSLKSWQHCNANTVIRNCSHYHGHKFNGCAQHYVEVPPLTNNDSRTTKFARRCAYMEDCLNMEKKCNGYCKLRCCGTNMCNGASSGQSVNEAVMFAIIVYSLYSHLYLKFKH